MPFRPAFLEITPEEFKQSIQAFELQRKKLLAEMEALLRFEIDRSGLVDKDEIDKEIADIRSNDREYVTREQSLEVEVVLQQKIERDQQRDSVLDLSEDEFYRYQRIVLGAIGTLGLDAPSLQEKFSNFILLSEVAGADKVYIYIR